MKTWFITGASRGFGLLVVEEALSRGDNVVATARSPQRVLDAVRDRRERLLALPLDVTDRGSVDTAVAAAIERFGHIDVLMNNAGHGMVGAIEESTAGNYRAMFDVNVFGLVNVTQAVLPGMRARHSGRIINLSSVAGQSAAPGWGMYAASKHAVEAISDTLGAELAPLGIDCVAIEPGPFRTDFLDGTSLLTEQNTIGDYQRTAVATTRRWARETNHNQLGDPARFGPIVVDLGHADSVPPRLALGSDTVARIAAKIDNLSSDLETWRPVSESTDLHEAPTRLPAHRTHLPLPEEGNMAKTWIVVPADSPAGRTLVQRLLDDGDRVVTTARNPLVMEDLKTRHATTLTVYRADDATDAVDRAFAEHSPIDVIVGPDPLLRAAAPHLVVQGGGLLIESSDLPGPETIVRVVATRRNPGDLDSWIQTTLTAARGGTSLTEEQLSRLQPGLWGQASATGS